ncbi:MAG: histidine phosphatase family protein [Alphaproteobacteria bacterium]|nr:histidine phosphatase family protein [Alphaproteobacteria bacterium]
MTRVALIRHGPTAWNEAGRIQGRRDTPLSDGGRGEVGRWRVPAELADFAWISSPLVRAVETARLLGAPEPLATDARLAEMHWGAWEGLTLADIRRRGGETARANEDRGLDFRPHGGESPREVQVRVGSWLADIAAAGTPTLAVAHKGVIRAIFALASGWDMRGKPPHKMAWAAAHAFDIDDGGRPRIGHLNLPLVET